MLRALLVLCILVTVVEAAPKYPRTPSTAPELAAAEKLWSAAVAEPDRTQQAARWSAAATAFLRVVEAGTAGKGVQADAANAAMLAWKNAIDVGPSVAAAAPSIDRDFDKIPTPLPLEPRDALVIRIVDAYLAFSPPPDEAAAAKFLRANVLRRREHLDKAIAGFLEILEHHRDHEVAEYAANLALDSYNRLQRHEDLMGLAEKLYVDTRFLAGKPDLAATVRNIHTIREQQLARADEKRAKETGDLGYYDRCGEQYVALLANPGLDPRTAEETRYNAGVCFQAAGSIARAVAIYRELIKRSPRSPLAARALARLGVAEGNVAHFREAIDAFEEYAQRYAGEKDALDATSDAVFYAVAIGDLVRASTLADFAILTFGMKRPQLVVEINLALLDAQLAAGKRKDSAARARRVANMRVDHRFREPVTAFRGGRGVAAAACPVALVDDLCPKPRDKTLVVAARQMLARTSDRTAPSTEALPLIDAATRIALDLDLEPVLAARPATTPARVAVARGYTDLIAATKQPEVRIAAHARLGTLHRHSGDRVQALRELRACVAESRATMAGSEWLARCERDLAALREPDLDILPERLARPSAAPVLALEAPRQVPE